MDGLENLPESLTLDDLEKFFAEDETEEETNETSSEDTSTSQEDTNEVVETTAPVVTETKVEDGRTVPLAALRAEREEKRQIREQLINIQKEFEEFRNRNNQPQVQPQNTQPQPQVKDNTPPDPDEEPIKWVEYQLQLRDAELRRVAEQSAEMERQALARAFRAEIKAQELEIRSQVPDYDEAIQAFNEFNAENPGRFDINSLLQANNPPAAFYELGKTILVSRNPAPAPQQVDVEALKAQLMKELLPQLTADAEKKAYESIAAKLKGNNSNNQTVNKQVQSINNLPSVPETPRQETDIYNITADQLGRANKRDLDKYLEQLYGAFMGG